MALPRNAAPQWRKATKSGNSGNCVEAADVVDAVLVRDTKQNGRGPQLRFTPQAWSIFTADCKIGKYDL